MRTTQGIRLGGNRAFINLYVNGKSATRVKKAENLRYVAKNRAWKWSEAADSHGLSHLLNIAGRTGPTP